MSGFWQKLNKPFWALAPMEDVTDTVFRQIVASVGKPDVFFSEFTSVDGLCSVGKDKVLQRLKYSPKERPIVAQLWGTDPQKFYLASQLAADLGFDGIDINLGCPVADVVKQGACSALISNDPGIQSQVKEIILAVKAGLKLPVSVKTRIGQSQVITQPWVSFLLTLDLAALTIHARTAKEKSEVPAHWDEIGKAVKLRNSMKSPTLIIGNGDVNSLDQARELVEKFGVDGVMVGRAALANPAFFSHQQLNPSQRLKLFTTHISLFEKTWGKNKNYAVLKKFVKAYINGFEGAGGMREKLMTSRDLLSLKSKLSELMQ